MPYTHVTLYMCTTTPQTTLQPENILLSSTVYPQIRLADFGLSLLNDTALSGGGCNEDEQGNFLSAKYLGGTALHTSVMANTTRTQGTMTCTYSQCMNSVGVCYNMLYVCICYT